MGGASFAWLEITGKCQLSCKHCYAESGPDHSFGDMTRSDWLRVIEEAAEVGVRNVQFIGGEPTLHPSLSEFVERASNLKMQVEVFSNLVNISEKMWGIFARFGTTLATSFYSDSSTEHESVTKRPGSFSRTLTSIREAVKRSIPIRVGVIEVLTGQRVTSAVTMLQALGVKEIGVDRTRKIGRGSEGVSPNANELCGKCTLERVAISTSGDVWPCVFSRWLPVGNVRTDSLQNILRSKALENARAQLDSHFSVRGLARDNACYPDCGPACGPNCPPSCSPSCSPAGNCTPSGNCWPNYR